MKIEDKLYEMWCPRDIEGKTISKVYHDRHDPVMAFSDGAYFCRQYPQDLMETYQFLTGEETEDHPLVSVGVLTVHEINTYWEEMKQEFNDRDKASRRRQYEILKEEFEI